MLAWFSKTAETEEEAAEQREAKDETEAQIIWLLKRAKVRRLRGCCLRRAGHGPGGSEPESRGSGRARLPLPGPGALHPGCTCCDSLHLCGRGVPACGLCLRRGLLVRCLQPCVFLQGLHYTGSFSLSLMSSSRPALPSLAPVIPAVLANIWLSPRFLPPSGSHSCPLHVIWQGCLGSQRGHQIQLCPPATSCGLCQQPGVQAVAPAAPQSSFPDTVI